MRAPRAHARGAASRWKRSALEERDVDGLRALVARLGVIRDLRALGEGAEAVRVDAGVVHEEVLAPLVGRDEAEALVVVEPLNDSGGHDVERTLHGAFCVLHAEGCRWQRLRALALLSPSPSLDLTPQRYQVERRLRGERNRLFTITARRA